MRIERADLNWGYFYQTHPDSYFFSTLLGIDNVYLEDFYGELKRRTAARSVDSDGVYFYSWEFWSVDDMVGKYDEVKDVYDNIEDDPYSNFYYVRFPKNALPLTKSISLTFGGPRISTADESTIEFVDFQGWFALKVPKAAMQIVYKNKWNGVSANAILAGFNETSNILTYNGGSGLGLYYTGNPTFYVCINKGFPNEEIVLVSANKITASGEGQLSVVRGQKNTAPQLHLIGEPIQFWGLSSGDAKLVLRDGLAQTGIWLVEYYKDENYIEDHFGKLINVFIDRSLYTNIFGGSRIQNRVRAVLNGYSELMKDLIIMMMNYHPSPANILTIAKSIVNNYGLTDFINKVAHPDALEPIVEIRDRILDHWPDLITMIDQPIVDSEDRTNRWLSAGMRSLFFINYDMHDKDERLRSNLFDVMSRMIAYFKPIFTWCGLLPNTSYGTEPPDDITIDDNIADSEISLRINDYITGVIVMPSLAPGSNLTTEGVFSSISDEIEIIYIPEYVKIGDV